jgi:flagellar hook assembly protein FlgD
VCGAEITLIPEVPVTVEAQLAVYDVTGRTVRAWGEESYGPGTHLVHWDGRDAAGGPVPSGVYFYRLQAGDFSATRMLVMSR